MRGRDSVPETMRALMFPASLARTPEWKRNTRRDAQETRSLPVKRIRVNGQYEGREKTITFTQRPLP